MLTNIMKSKIFSSEEIKQFASMPHFLDNRIIIDINSGNDPIISKMITWIELNCRQKVVADIKADATRMFLYFQEEHDLTTFITKWAK